MANITIFHGDRGKHSDGGTTTIHTTDPTARSLGRAASGQHQQQRPPIDTRTRKKQITDIVRGGQPAHTGPDSTTAKLFFYRARAPARERTIKIREKENKKYIYFFFFNIIDELITGARYQQQQQRRRRR